MSRSKGVLPDKPGRSTTVYVRLQGEYLVRGNGGSTALLAGKVLVRRGGGGKNVP